MNRNIDDVLSRLKWMREEQIWPNGLRYLWTDAFGVALLVSLYHRLNDDRFLAEAEWVVHEVDRVLGRPIGIRIGQQPDRDGQYFHYLAMWLFALKCLGTIKPEYHQKAIELARAIHSRFVIPHVGVAWKMLEDLSAPIRASASGRLIPSTVLSFTGCSQRRICGRKLFKWVNSSSAPFDCCTSRKTWDWVCSYGCRISSQSNPGR